MLKASSSLAYSMNHKEIECVSVDRKELHRCYLTGVAPLLQQTWRLWPSLWVFQRLSLTVQWTEVHWTVRLFRAESFWGGSEPNQLLQVRTNHGKILSGSSQAQSNELNRHLQWQHWQVVCRLSATEKTCIYEWMPSLFQVWRQLEPVFCAAARPKSLCIVPW